MSQPLPFHHQNMGPRHWAVIIVALTVCLPVTFLCERTDFSSSQMRLLPFTPWVAIPLVGSMIGGYLMSPMHRGKGMACGILTGFGGFWVACIWASGSRATSITEIAIAALIGMVPGILLYLGLT